MIRRILALWTFFRLNLLKLLIFPLYRSAKDLDRLRFEFHLCLVAQEKNKKILYVGIHERSFVYQLVFPFTFCDMARDFLINTERMRFGPCQNLEEEFDLVVLSGVFNYGSNNEEFERILQHRKFKEFLILDWKKNINFHLSLTGKNLQIRNLDRSFYYYYER